jgi:lysyl-tRNA synthetase, class II
LILNHEIFRPKDLSNEENFRMTPQTPTTTEPPQDENKLIAERRGKLNALREVCNAYPNDFRPDAFCGDLQERFKDQLDAAAIEAQGVRVKVAGRLLAKRLMGKASFAQIQDFTGQLQLFVQQTAIGEEAYTAWKTFDLGDVVAAEGLMFRTKTGELSVKCDQFRLLTKSLRPLPDKWAGLSDVEKRYRHRYVDLIINPESRAVFIKRSKIIRYIRSFLEGPDYRFLEVETPMMHIIPGGATARPFVTHHNALDLDLYLRVAPELFLKRLTVGGLDRVYEINRNFRNEGVSTRHNPEFTMLEFYWAYASFTELMDLTEKMFRGIAHDVLGTAQFSYQGHALDFAKPFARMRMDEAVCAHNPDITLADCTNLEALRGHCARLKIKHKPTDGWGKLLLAIFEATVEEHLIQPTFITHHPLEVSPLSRRNDEQQDMTDRFELFIAAREIANGFSELNDPEDQAERFRAQVESKEAGDDEAMHFDDDYIRALEYGMPPTAGEGIGIDRLVMLLTDAASIRDVLLFPYMRPE